MAEPPRLTTTQIIVRAIVALNFNERDKALALLLGALTDQNFDSQEKANGNAAAAN